MASRAPETTTATAEGSVVEHVARLCKALADPLRLRLVAITGAAPAGEVCFCDLADAFTMPQSSLSHHLRVLVTAGILERERRGTWSWYRLHPETLAVLRDAIDPDGALTRLDPAAPTGRECREPHPDIDS